MKLGLAIHIICKQKGLTMHEVATAAGISQTSMSLLTNNRTKPHQNTIDSLCIALDISEDYLYLTAIDYKVLTQEQRKSIITLILQQI